MKRRKRTFNDDYYDQAIEDFEDETFSERYWSEFMLWGFGLFPAVVIVGTVVAGSDWRKWIVIVAAAYLFLQEPLSFWTSLAARWGPHEALICW